MLITVHTPSQAEAYRSTLDRIARCPDLARIYRQHKPLSRKLEVNHECEGGLGRKRQVSLYFIHAEGHTNLRTEIAS